MRTWVIGGLLIAVGCGDDIPSVAMETGDGLPTSGAPGTTSSETPDESTTGTGATEDDTSSGSDDSTGEPPFEPPACDSEQYDWQSLIPGPAEVGWDPDLAAAALAHDRLSASFVGWSMGLDADVRVDVDDAEGRAAVDAFFDGDGWDFETVAGTALSDVVSSFDKATGAYAGVAIAADAYRYGTLRDQGAPCDDVDQARAQLVRSLEGLDRVITITGEPGLVARAIARTDLPGSGQSPTTPLFDGDGNPLPLEKNNGTWRDDNSGRLPGYQWEDSCSRDQFEGWILGMAAAWEVMRLDDTFDAELKARLQMHARDIALQLAMVRPSGYDLEIWDPEGRATLHGYLHENNLEGSYVGLINGFHALMAIGIVGALAYVAEDPEVDAYLRDELIDSRNLPGLANSSLLIDFGASTNFSNYNMAFAAGWMALRYLDDEEAQQDIYETIQRMYDNGGDRQPSEQGQALYDLVWAATESGATAFEPPSSAADDNAVDAALATLGTFPVVPAYNDPVEHCDADEIAAMSCTLDDGTVVGLLGAVGHNDELVADVPIPMALRPWSNYHWRSNPYRVNGGGDGGALAGSADFRFVYWMGRWTRR